MPRDLCLFFLCQQHRPHVATNMADFIMTMSSDEEAPAPATSAKPAAAKAKKTKLSRKEQLKNAKGLKKLKRKRVDSASEEEEEDDGGMAGPASGDEEQVMAEDFHFDGLGGGFVGERRQQVWVR